MIPYFAEDLAWQLKDIPDDSFKWVAVEELLLYRNSLNNRTPNLNSDLADLQVTRCIKLVDAALKQHGY